MRPSDRDLQQLGPFRAGINNLSRETSVPRAALREAVNVVLSDDGKVRRREGYELLEPLPGATSIFASGRRGFVSAGGTLFTFEAHGQALSGLTPIAAGLRADARLTSALIEPDLFVSDGAMNLRIDPSNNITPWSVDEAAMPVVSAAPGGALTAGRYEITITYRNALGEEGPASLPGMVEVLADASAILVQLPPVPSIYPRVAIYATKPNGTEPLLVGHVPRNAGTVTISDNRRGRPCPTLDLYPLPPAEHALYWRSRLWLAGGSVLVASEPFQYGLYRPDETTMHFAEQITGIGTTGEAGGGIFVGQESRTYYARGDRPNALALEEKYPAGIVVGTLTMVPGAQLPLDAPPTEPVPMWLATNGVVCVGLPDGSVLPLTETRFAADVGATGAGAFIQKDGESRFVATTAEPSENGFAVRDEVVFEVVRNGIPITV